MSPEQAAVLSALRGCSLPIGSADKRFIRDMPADAELSERQHAYLLALRWKYRRQISATVPGAIEGLRFYRMYRGGRMPKPVREPKRRAEAIHVDQPALLLGMGSDPSPDRASES